MTTQAANAQDVTSLLVGDDDFMAELEAELNANEVEAVDLKEIGTSDIDDLEAELEAALNSVEESQKAELEEPAEPEKKPSKKPAKKAKAEDADAEKPAANKRESLSGLLPSAAMQKAFGDKLYDHCAVTEKMVALKGAERNAAVDELLAAVDGLAKKVREKAINTFQAVAGQAQLSIYTQTALNLLKEKGEFSCTDLKNVYLKRPYSPGTSSAQSSQMMMLLPTLGVATRSGNLLVAREDSVLLKLFTE